MPSQKPKEVWFGFGDTMYHGGQKTGHWKLKDCLEVYLERGWTPRSRPYPFIGTGVVSSHLDKLPSTRELGTMSSMTTANLRHLWATQVKFGIRGKERTLHKNMHSEPWDSMASFLPQSFVLPNGQKPDRYSQIRRLGVFSGKTPLRPPVMAWIISWLPNPTSW